MNNPIPYHRVADLYDVFVQVDFDIPFFLQEAEKSGGEVLELMSGTGRVSVPLIESGVHLTCVDISSAMLEYLRQKLDARHLSATVHQMDVCKLDLGKRFNLIFIPFHSFAEIISPTSQLEALKRIHSHLAEKGRFICTLHNPAIRLKSVDGLLHLWKKSPMPEGRQLLFWGLENSEESSNIVRIQQFYEEYGADGVLQSKRHLEVRFCPLRKDEFKALALTAGFKISAVYGDYAYSPFEEETSPFMIWVLE